MGDALPFVSVVIPALDAEDTIAECVRSVLSGDYPATRREVIVVDNGSTDQTADVVAELDVRYVFEARRGAAAARNAGVRASRGEILAFIDSDCLASTGWLRAIVAAFESERVGGVAGEIVPFPPATSAERYAARIRHLSPAKYLRRPIFPFAVTANLAFRRDVFESVGPFDPLSPRGGESTDYCTRFFRTTGRDLQLASAAVVLHRHRETLLGFLRQQWSYGRGHAFLYRKYRDDIPWGWRQTARVYRDLADAGFSLVRSAGGFSVGRVSRDEFEFTVYDFCRKAALRAGFAWEALARGRVR